MPGIQHAMFSSSFPINPIPFADGLADHVRLFGTNSIKSDEAKQILWVLMAQAYGSLTTIDLSEEWRRLHNNLNQDEYLATVLSE